MSDFEKRLKALEESNLSLKRELDDVRKTKITASTIVVKEKEKRPPKPPSKYNMFVSETIRELKDKHPELNNKQLLSMAAEKWQKVKNTL